jgi:hypothetical protein
MKIKKYFQYDRQREDRKNKKDEWINYTMANPLRQEVQTDGRIKKWAKINEADKYLRVILLPDGETVHNAFFDRDFKEE